MKILLTTICLSAPALMSSQTTATDSIKSKELNEIAVEGQLQRTSPTVSTYIPTTKQKNASQNGYDLLNRMAIPQLRTSPGLSTSVQTVSGQNVDIFIDYLPASSEDINGMRMTDVKRVEYINYPTDPRFQGKAHVVNFIMHQYEYGGYVKAAGSAYLISNSYSANVMAKLQYKRMTYDLALGGYYYDSKHLYSNTTETFRLPVGDNAFRDIVRETTTDDARVRNKYIWPTFKVLYKSDNITLRNTLGTNFDSYPVKKTSGLVSYSYASDLAPESFYSDTSSKNNSLTYSGDWNFIINDANSLNVTPYYSYKYTSNLSNYFEDEVRLSNLAKDHTHSAGLNLLYYHSFGKAGNLTAALAGSMIRNNTEYSGTTDAHDITTMWNAQSYLQYNFNNDVLNCSARVGINWNQSKLGDVGDNKLSPTGMIYLQYSPSSRHSLSLYTSYSVNNPGGQYRTNAVIQQSPLMSNTGNPYLTPEHNYNINLSYTWLPSNKFNLGPFVNFYTVGNRYAYYYEALPTGILKSIVQPAGGYSDFGAGVFATYRLLDNKLTLYGQLYYDYVYDGGQFNLKKSFVRGTCQATYYLDNWNFGAYYVTGSTSSRGSMSGYLEKSSSSYGILAGWGNSSWNFQTYICNFARWHWKDAYTTLTTPNYTYAGQAFTVNQHCFILLSATYTFGFGKKVQVGDEATQQTGASSGILN